MISVSEASKLCGRSVPTIYRHIKKGKLSAHTDTDGNKVIDPSELQRCYGAIDNHVKDSVPQRESGDSQQRVEDLTRHIKSLEATVDDLRTRLDRAEENERLVLRLLSDQRSNSTDDPSPKKKKSKGKKSKKGKKKVSKKDGKK